MKFFSNSMNPIWKLSFVATVLYLAYCLVEAFFGGSYIRGEFLIWGIGPISVWFSARWVALGATTQQGGLNERGRISFSSKGE